MSWEKFLRSLKFDRTWKNKWINWNTILKRDFLEHRKRKQRDLQHWRNPFRHKMNLIVFPRHVVMVLWSIRMNEWFIISILTHLNVLSRNTFNDRFPIFHPCPMFNEIFLKRRRKWPFNSMSLPHRKGEISSVFSSTSFLFFFSLQKTIQSNETNTFRWKSLHWWGRASSFSSSTPIPIASSTTSNVRVRSILVVDLVIFL